MTAGDIISRYRISGQIGQGGMGVVYKAEDTRLNRPVALKFLPPDSLDEQDRERLVNEAQAAALIRHPNVCPIYDVEEADGQTFIAMAWLEGETLAHRVARGPLAITAAIDFAIQIAKGLEAAHALGVIHRDIKSSNILVGADGHVSILDFGLALRAGATRITAVGKAAGTPGYMSPEQVRGQAIDRRTDVWSLGVLLFEMVTGSLPFRRDHQAAVTHAIAFDETPAVTSLRPDTPPELRRIIETAVAKRPEDRWQTAREMAAALHRLQGGLASQGLAPSFIATRTMITSVRRKWRKGYVAMAAAAVLCLTGVAGYEYYRSRTASRSAASVADLSRQVAILPFHLTAEDAGARTISDGLLEILTEALSTIDPSQGIAMTVPASEVLRRGITSVADARRFFGVDLVIAGSAEPRGNSLHCTLRLIDAVSGRQTASTEFDYDPASPRDARNRAIEHMDNMLGVSPNRAALNPGASSDSAAPGAYSAYLEGRGLMARYDVGNNLEKAGVSFRRAVDLDPNFALAWAGLGEAYWREARTSSDTQAAALAAQSAEHAVQLDPDLAIAHSVLGSIYGMAGKSEDAIAQLRQAISLAPGNAEAPRELARVYQSLGRFAEAETLYLNATRARPTDWYGHLLLGLFYQDRERYGEAEAAYRRAMELAPGNEIVARNIGVLYLETGRYAEAVAVLQKSLAIRADASTYGTLAATYYYQHRFQDAASAIETAIDLNSGWYPFWGNAGIYYKWIPGAGSKVAPALHRAIDLAQKSLEVTPGNYETRADLAEYHARLGDSGGAMEEIARIPMTARPALASRLALAYELIGNRAKAIELIQRSLTNPATLNQIKDDPDLRGLWADPEFQKVVPKSANR